MNHNSKLILLPSYCENLAEEIGIHIGDGNVYIRNNSYVYTITLHLYEDSDYSNYIINSIKRLYGITPSIKIVDDRNAKYIAYHSKRLIDFKHGFGLPIGPKTNIEIPKWILTNKKFVISCIRGIVDTDGSLSFRKKHRKNHYY